MRLVVKIQVRCLPCYIIHNTPTTLVDTFCTEFRKNKNQKTSMISTDVDSLSLFSKV